LTQKNLWKKYSFFTIKFNWEGQTHKWKHLWRKINWRNKKAAHEIIWTYFDSSWWGPNWFYNL